MTKKETYNGVSVSSLQKLGITHKVKIADNGMKYIVLYPTQQQLNTPEMAVAIGDKKILTNIKKYFGHILCGKCENILWKDTGDKLIISGLRFNDYLQDSYPVECVDYIDVHSIQREVCDSLVAEIESNPELIYPLLMQPKGFFSAKAILKSIADTIVIKFAADKNSDAIINEVTASGKNAEAIVIIPQYLLKYDTVEKIRDYLDTIINHVSQKVRCNINRDIFFEDDNLMITIDVAK